jgi:hypothetical protein
MIPSEAGTRVIKAITYRSESFIKALMPLGRRPIS